MKSEKKIVVLGPGQGDKVGTRRDGGGATVKVGARQTGGTVSVLESLRTAGDAGGPPLHRHAFDKAFYVLEGAYDFRVDSETVCAEVGSFVYVPGGTAHAFRHTGHGVGRLLTICHPGGIEEIFEANDPVVREAREKKHAVENLGPAFEGT